MHNPNLFPIGNGFGLFFYPVSDSLTPSGGVLLTNRRLKMTSPYSVKAFSTPCSGAVCSVRDVPAPQRSFEEILQQKAQIPLQKQGEYGILILKMVVPLEEPFPEEPKRPKGK